MSSVDELWCDWCGEPIRADGRRHHDGRPFCGDACLVAYQRRADPPTVVDFGQRE